MRDFYEGDDKYLSLSFNKEKAMPSLAQLLSALSPFSVSLLPQPLAELMIHPSSPIAQFYPKEFTTDPNGKRQPWEHVVRIPFVDESLILQEVERIVTHEKECMFSHLVFIEKNFRVYFLLE